MHDSAVEQVKERLTIVDVVSQYVKLTKAGKNYRGLSPFNREKTPSFYVSPDRGMYYCFSSSKGGDIFTFVQEMEGVDFRGALKLLADRAGVELKRENREARDQRERLFHALEAATIWFTEQLAHRSEAKSYLHERGVNDESISTWRIGYAPAGWTNLFDALKAQGYQDDELERVGLIKKGDKGSYYDRFRGRIMFPIFDTAGRPVAFSGRIFDEEEGKEPAKYLNSPETVLYDKSKILYGYDQAKQTMRKYDFAIIVEGQMDLVMSHQAGWRNAVAVSGTGLTDQHLELIDRLTKNVVMAFDADAAGFRSAGRSAMMALSRGMDVKVVSLPEGVDPADCIKDDPQQWKDAIKSAVHIIDFYLNTLRAKVDDDRKFAKSVQALVLPFVARIKSAIERAQFVKRVASRLGVPDGAVQDEVALLQRTQPTDLGRSAHQTTNTADTPTTTMSRFERLLETMIVLVWQAETTGDTALRSEVVNTVGDVVFNGKEQTILSEKEKRLFEFEIQLETIDDLQAYTNEVLRDLTSSLAKEESVRVARALQEAEARGDKKKVAELLKRSQELMMQIHQH